MDTEELQEEKDRKNQQNYGLSMTIEIPKKEVTHPVEVLELYGPVLERVTFLNDSTPVRPGVNQNQLEAVERIMATVVEFKRRKEGAAIANFGPMGAGKTTVVCLLAGELKEEDSGVYKHRLDLARTGMKLINHTGNIWTRAELYESVNDLEETEEILLIDEFQFNTVDTAEEIIAFLQKRKEKRLHTIISQLDFNYRRDPWRTTKILLPHFDRIFVLGARCEECGNVAQFVQRKVDGQPAHINDPEIVVGAEELYLAKCGHCHRVGGKPSTTYV